MELFIYTFLFIIIFFGILGIIYLTFYNQMKNFLMRINEAELIIDESLRNRYDLIIRADNIFDKSIEINLDIIEEIKKTKNQKISSFDFDRKTIECIDLIKQIKKDFQSLDNNQSFKEIMQEIKNGEEKIDAAKSFYNKYTSSLNTLISKFPSNIIAKIHTIKLKNFFDDKDLHDDIFDDFKI